MRVSFDGTTYDLNDPDYALNDACIAKAGHTVRKLKDEDLRPALEALMAGAMLIAVKFGATAALHHAYAAPVDYEMCDAFAHTFNKLVGLQYVPPEQIVIPPEEISSDTEEAVRT